MKKLLFNNTYKSGSVTYIVVEDDERKGKFLGVCLEFDLEVSADTSDEAMEQIRDYAALWLRNAKKNKLPEEVLNRPAPQKYWALYKGHIEYELKKLEAEQKKKVEPTLKPQPLASCQIPYFNFAF